MRYFILSTLLMLTVTIPISSAENYDKMSIRKIEANPINVAVRLTEQPDSAAVVATLGYYGYQPVEGNSSLKTQDSRLKTEYKHPNGSIIRFAFTPAENGKSYPKIEVKSNTSQKEKDKILRNLNFQKNGNSYERKSIDHRTRCSSASQGYLSLSTHPKEKK